MSKQVTAKELAEIVTKLLTNTQNTGELKSVGSFKRFMTDIAQVVCNHCGGEVRNSARPPEDIWCVDIGGNDRLPDPDAGIWRTDDPQEGTPEWYQAKFGQEDPSWPKAEWRIDVACGDTKLGYWNWVRHNMENTSGNLSVCSDCGQQVEGIVGCPDGAEVCRSCFDAH